MDAEFDYLQHWLDRYPECKIDEKKPISFFNFDWAKYDTAFLQRANAIFWAITQTVVGGRIVHYWGARSGYGKDGLKSDHAREIIKQLLGTDYLRGNNIVGRLSNHDTSKQPHIINQNTRLEKIEKILDNVYGTNERLVAERNRMIKNASIDRDGQPILGNTNQKITAYFKPTNFIQAAKWVRVGHMRRPHPIELDNSKKSDKQKEYEKYYFQEYQPSVNFISTTQDTPKMVADFMSKITKVVDYDRIYLMPCLRTGDNYAKSIFNMVRNNKKNIYGFSNDLGEQRRAGLNSARGANQKGAILIIPAGYSIPPMKIKHWFTMGSRNKRDLLKNCKDSYNYGYGIRARNYSKSELHRRIPNFSKIFNFFMHEKHNSNRWSAMTHPFLGYGSAMWKYQRSGLPFILNSIWKLFDGHSIYPTYFSRMTISHIKYREWLMKNKRDTPFYYDMMNKTQGMLSNFYNMEGGGYNLNKDTLDALHNNNLKLHKYLRQKDYGDIVVGSEQFYEILKPAITNEHRNMITSSMYDNQYIEINTRGALYTMNYIVSGIPIYEGK